MTSPLTAVAAALTDEQRQAIVDRFTTMNPGWRGATAADILDTLSDVDSDLAVTEPFFDAHPDLIVDGAGVAARALIWSGQELTEAGVRRLLGEPMSPKVDKQTPAWVLDIVEDTIRAGEQKLRDHMLSIDEDITDTPLWVHRRGQFRSLLAEQATPVPVSSGTDTPKGQ